MSLFRTILCGILLLVVPLSTAAFTDDDDGGHAGARGSISVTYSGSFNAVKLYIRARSEDRYRYYGLIRREHTRTIRLPSGRVYLIRLRNGSYRSVKRVYLPLSGNREVVFFAPNITGITVTLRGPWQWARLSVNGEEKGRVLRGIPRQLELDAGRSYTIRVFRNGRERVRRIRLRSRGPGRHRRITVFLLRD